MKNNWTNPVINRNSVKVERHRIGYMIAAAAIALAFLWTYSSNSSLRSVSAENSTDLDIGATADMLAYALNFKSASNLAVFGGNSVTDDGSTDFRGTIGSPGKISVGAADSLSGDSAARAKRDLLDAMSAVDQLPCTHLDTADLTGRSFAPGVYCVGSASLTGSMAVDAGGDSNARFIFRIDGKFTASDASSVTRVGGARATNVYFFSTDAATIGSDAEIDGNIFSRDSVRLGHGTTVKGKVIGVNGDVETSANVVGGASGYIEICKAIAGNTNPVIAPGTIFTFTIEGLPGTILVPAGGCSSPIKVEAGNVIVTEAAVPNVSVVNITTSPADRRVSSNYGLQQAVVSVVEGDVASETIVTFTNQPTRTGVLEICKFALDSDVTGFFTFTVQGSPGQEYSVPVGFCSGPITVTNLQFGSSQFATNVTELAKVNYRLQTMTTFPANALNGQYFDQGFDKNGLALMDNTNGGFANVLLNVGNGPANQVTVRFFNRSLPGRIKVCKITADPTNIPSGTAFSFTISGTAWTSLTNPAPMGMTSTFDVLAGPASQGGFCAFAPGRWNVGSPVFVGENGINAATNSTILPLDKPSNGGYPGYTNLLVRLSSITSSTAFLSLPTTVDGSAAPFPATVNPPNPNIKGAVGQTGASVGSTNYVGYGVIAARNTTAEMTFTNFVYRPAILKLCKVAGAGVAPGTVFEFTIAPADPTTTWAYPTGTIRIPAGTCVFVDGPFPGDPAFPGVKLFNFATSIIVTESAVSGTAVSAITSPTLTPVPNPNPPNFVGTLTADLANRKATLTLNQILFIGNPPTNYYFNELSFTNVAAAVPPPASRVRYDFRGDHTSDVAVFRPSDGTWYYSSYSGGPTYSVRFGQAGDRPVAADFDGDGITDPAVYRNGQWFVLGSSAGFSAISFGLATDIPMPGDYDGDGKADFAVYRPSEGTWYFMGSSEGFWAEQFGISTDIPVNGDWDSDGKTDIAVFRNGTWFINMSTNGFVARGFGMTGDIPIPADYDGDGRTDTAVYRGGTWYIMGSYDGFYAIQFGVDSDTPVPADYDGDGKTDAAVFRPTSKMWYVSPSSQSSNAVAGISARQFGDEGDLLMRY